MCRKCHLTVEKNKNIYFLIPLRYWIIIIIIYIIITLNHLENEYPENMKRFTGFSAAHQTH